MDWKQSACPLCTLNCGIEIRLGDDGRTFERVRGDKAHPASQGYTCEKALRLDHYQNGQRDRVTHPMRRRPDGTYEQVDWETAIREVAAGLVAVRDAHGGASIFYYGGGAQGNHLPGAYSAGTRRAVGSVFRSNALAQEKTGRCTWPRRCRVHMSTGTSSTLRSRCSSGRTPGSHTAFPAPGQC